MLFSSILKIFYIVALKHAFIKGHRAKNVIVIGRIIISQYNLSA